LQQSFASAKGGSLAQSQTRNIVASVLYNRVTALG
jgi:hypothetical protein